MAVDEHTEIIRAVTADLKCFLHIALDIRTKFTGDFTGNDDLSAGCHDLTRHAGVGIDFKTTVEDEVCDKIAKFVGMADADAFTGFVGFHFAYLLLFIRFQIKKHTHECAKNCSCQKKFAVRHTHDTNRCYTIVRWNYTIARNRRRKRKM